MAWPRRGVGGRSRQSRAAPSILGGRLGWREGMTAGGEGRGTRVLSRVVPCHACGV